MFTAGPLYSVRPPSQLLVPAVVHCLACYALPRCLFLEVLVSCQDISQLLTQHAGSPISGHNQLDNGECARKDARWPGAAHGPGWLCQVSHACAPLCFVHAVCDSLFLCTRHMSGHEGVPQCGSHDNSVSSDDEFVACAGWWELLS